MRLADYFVREHLNECLILNYSLSIQIQLQNRRGVGLSRTTVVTTRGKGLLHI